ncbi:MAG TPA: pimeloyl-[acyl-carrier protein] methyl ester esterase, partial [Pseudoxanthomonas sp.]|nr:pimeloyl-[acyl-carrier protein] methyl ester esterase [Pseudoxanthomonas sp.]
VPSLWISGRRDRLVPGEGMRTAAALSRGEFVGIERGAHAPFIGHADLVADRISAFASGIVGAA